MPFLRDIFDGPVLPPKKNNQKLVLIRNPRGVPIDLFCSALTLPIEPYAYRVCGTSDNKQTLLCVSIKKKRWKCPCPRTLYYSRRLVLWKFSRSQFSFTIAIVCNFPFFFIYPFTHHNHNMVEVWHGDAYDWGWNDFGMDVLYGRCIVIRLNVFFLVICVSMLVYHTPGI